MFSFHKPKIYRSNLGCCICRAKSSSSRFTDSKKYEPEFDKCFRTAEKRSGEICNACVLLVKRWKKLPTGTNRNWHHVVDARAGPGTKSFKNKPMSNGEPKKRVFGKASRNIAVESKLHHQSMTSSESESEEDDEEMDDLEGLVEGGQIGDGATESQRSLRRSTRLNTSGPREKGHLQRYKGTSATDRNNNLNGRPKRRTLLQPEHFFSFLDPTFWQKEKVCCGIIFKGPNNEVIIYPELLRPCGCRKQSAAFSLTALSAVSLSSPSSEFSLNTVSRSSSSTLLLSSEKPPTLVSVPVPPVARSVNAATSQATHNSTTSDDVSLVSKKVALQHQHSFTNSDTSSEPGSHDDIDDQSSGVSSMAACDDATMMAADSDRLSTTSSVCLIMDEADDGSSNASTATDDGLNHHELEMSSDDSPVKGPSSSSVVLASLTPGTGTAVFSATAMV